MEIQKNPVLNNTIIPYVGKNRILASMVDWIVGGIFSGIPSVIVFSMMTKSSKALTSMYQFESEGFSRSVTIMVALACLLFGFFYYVIVPWIIWPGQTLGKHWTHTKIVSQNKKKITFSTIVIRQFIFLVFVEGMATATSTYVKVLATTITRFYTDSYLTILWAVITLISMFLVFMSNKHLALHDLILKTTVIEETK